MWACFQAILCPDVTYTKASISCSVAAGIDPFAIVLQPVKQHTHKQQVVSTQPIPTATCVSWTLSLFACYTLCFWCATQSRQYARAASGVQHKAGSTHMQAELERDADTLKKEVLDVRLLAQRDIVLDPEAEMLEVLLLCLT